MTFSSRLYEPASLAAHAPEQLLAVLLLCALLHASEIEPQQIPRQEGSRRDYGGFAAAPWRGPLEFCVETFPQVLPG